MITTGIREDLHVALLGAAVAAMLLAASLAGCGAVPSATAAEGEGTIAGGIVSPVDAADDVPSMTGLEEVSSGAAEDTTCSADTCASGLSDDGYAFEWDGNSNGKDEVYALDAVRDAGGDITGYRLYTTCQQDYEGDLPDVRSVREIGMSSDDAGPFLAVSYDGVDGSSGRCIVRVVDDNLDIVCG